jgi:multiple sugar transport system permease protein
MTTSLPRPLRSGLFYVVLIGVVGTLVFPIYWMLNTSLSPTDELYIYPPRLIHPRATLEAYALVLGERPILSWMANSLFVATFTTATSLVMAVLAGYSLSRYPSKVGAFVGQFLLANRMVPTTLLIIPLFVIMQRLNLINSLYALVLANVTFVLPFATWMLKGYFDSIPRELDEAAQTDGCTPLGALLRVVLPLAAPGVAATAIYSFILAWDEYVFARTFLTGQDTWTVTVGLSAFQGEYVTYWNQVMAASLIGTIPVLIGFALLERHIVRGITAGAVK